MTRWVRRADRHELWFVPRGLSTGDVYLGHVRHQGDRWMAFDSDDKLVFTCEALDGPGDAMLYLREYVEAEGRKRREASK